MAREIIEEVTGSDFLERTRDDVRHLDRSLSCVGSCATVENEKMGLHCGDAIEERRHVNWWRMSLEHVLLVGILKSGGYPPLMAENGRRNPHSKHDEEEE